MEERIVVKGPGVRQEIIGESLFDCINTAYSKYKGQRVELIWTRRIGYIDGDDLFVEDDCLDRHSVKEIINNGEA